MFTSADGSTWKQIPASRLAAVEIWKGNRILDHNHTLRICQSLVSITDLTLNPYRIVILEDEGETFRYIIDGQHRVSLLKKHFANPDAEDFNVVVIEKMCQDESEVIDYFKIINTTKAIHWREDPILAANKYIDPFIKEFNKNPKKPVIRPGKVNKPYLSVDRLREVLVSKHVVDWRTTPLEFVARCREINDQHLSELDVTNTTNKRAQQIGFSLGMLDFNFI
jgi:hypothetical protein